MFSQDHSGLGGSTSSGQFPIGRISRSALVLALVGQVDRQYPGCVVVGNTSTRRCYSVKGQFPDVVVYRGGDQEMVLRAFFLYTRNDLGELTQERLLPLLQLGAPVTLVVPGEHLLLVETMLATTGFWQFGLTSYELSAPSGLPSDMAQTG